MSFRILTAILAATLSAAPAFAGQLQTLYQFQSEADGLRANYIAIQNGTIYGSSATGLSGKGRCANGCGEIFGLNPQTGQKTTIYSATDPKQGYLGDLTVSGANAYFSTSWCNKQIGCVNGTLGQANLATGKHKTLYTFGSNSIPYSPYYLGVRGGSLYVYNFFGGLAQFDFKAKSLTTFSLASGDVTSPVQFLGNDIFGTGSTNLFKFSPKSGKAKFLHYFEGNNGDGAFPEGPLYFQGTTIFGTTLTGGIAPPGNSGYGIVYTLDSNTGAETILHSFDVTDGIGPNSGLVSINGKLYGTTVNGGANSTICNQGTGCGTIFEIDPATGAFTSLYQFQAGADGYYPGNLIAGDGALYGTAQTAPTQACPQGCGTIFAYTP